MLPSWLNLECAIVVIAMCLQGLLSERMIPTARRECLHNLGFYTTLGTVLSNVLYTTCTCWLEGLLSTWACSTLVEVPFWIVSYEKVLYWYVGPLCRTLFLSHDIQSSGKIETSLLCCIVRISVDHIGFLYLFLLSSRKECWLHLPPTVLHVKDSHCNTFKTETAICAEMSCNKETLKTPKAFEKGLRHISL